MLLAHTTNIIKCNSDSATIFNTKLFFLSKTAQLIRTLALNKTVALKPHKDDKRISIIIFLMLHNVIHQVYMPLHFGIAKENYQGPKLALVAFVHKPEVLVLSTFT